MNDSPCKINFKIILFTLLCDIVIPYILGSISLAFGVPGPMELTRCENNAEDTLVNDWTE